MQEEWQDSCRKWLGRKWLDAYRLAYNRESEAIVVRMMGIMSPTAKPELHPVPLILTAWYESTMKELRDAENKNT